MARNFVANALSLIAIALCMLASGYLFAPDDERNTYYVYALLIVAATPFVFFYILNKDGDDEISPWKWVKDFLLGSLLFSLMFGFDFLLGLGLNPAHPLNTFLFAITVFLLPIYVATLFGLLRAAIHALLNNKM